MSSRIASCTRRMLARAEGARTPQLKRYIERTYCDPFARQGWVYADGTLSIDAHLWLLKGANCAQSQNGGPAVTVPCRPSYDPLDCALLHFVRRAEVQTYIESVSRKHRVRCDDGTPLGKLGS